jgi:hypothetical protein
LGFRDLRRDFLDYDRLLLTIETHGLNTPSKDALGKIPVASTECGEPGRVLKKKSSVDAVCAGSRNILGLSFALCKRGFSCDELGSSGL